MGGTERTMSKPFYTSAAGQDLADIHNYIARDNPTAALIPLAA